MQAWLKRWRWVGLFLLLLMASAGPAALLVRAAYGRLGEGTVGRLVLGLVVLVLAALLLRAWRRNRGGKRAPLFYAGLLAVGILYALCLRYMAPYPVEKIHFLSFGFLAYLVYAALERKGPGDAWIQALCLVAFLGFLDEVYQGLLPSRRYDPRDILVNLAAGFLGLVLTLLLRRVSPCTVLKGLGHARNAPYLLLGPLAVAIYFYIHAVPLPTETVPGTWRRVGDCGVKEWLRLDRDHGLTWWDEAGNRARGTYRITGNRLEGVYFHSACTEAQNESDCGWRPGLEMDLKIRVDAERLLFVHGPERPWARVPGGDIRRAAGTGLRTDPDPGPGGRT